MKVELSFALIAKGILLLLLLIVLTGLSVLFVRGDLELVEEAVDNGYSDEAERNQLLAAKLLLEQREQAVTVSHSLASLDHLPPPENGALLMLTTTHQLGALSENSVLNWVSAGGHLITNVSTITEGSEADNFLLRELQVAVAPLDEEQLVTGDGQPGWLLEQMLDRWSCACRSEDHKQQIEWLDGESLQISLPAELILKDEGGLAIWRAGDDYGDQVLQFEVGQGKVTLFADMGIWKNRAIGYFDHAYLLTKLVEQREVMVLHYRQLPSLFSLLWQRAAPVVLLLGVLLLCWLWSRSLRLGPLLPVALPQRRGLLQHLQAGMMFAWRRGFLLQSIERLRLQIMQRMGLHHPGFASFSRSEQMGLIAQRSHLSEAEVGLYMQQTEIQQPQQLIELVRCLQKIRNAL